MNNNKSPHTFHVPVMGTGFTIESPLKLAQYGISSVVPITDHFIMEHLIKIHSEKNGLDYTPTNPSDRKNRALIIKNYLNLLYTLVHRNFENLKQSDFEEGSEINKYFELLPVNTPQSQVYAQMLKSEGEERASLQEKLRQMVHVGEIDVNIMTKLDGVNYDEENNALPIEYNDAHAAIEGFATSNLTSSVVLSAGLNPRLYSHMATFDDFFPNENGRLKKRITLKVSDYRSAMVQGRFLAKKGLWVSEFRVESGLNCGGHAFASDGYLLGPILKEFKDNKDSLIDMLHNEYVKGLKSQKNIEIEKPLQVIYTVQGGVGDTHEHQMLLEHYGLESVGWGSPFLLVPEAVTLDSFTQNLLKDATEDDFYLSDVSPMGVPFNSVRGNWADKEKQKRIDAGKPGAVCLKKFLQFNTEFTERTICSASVQYQKIKIAQLKETINNPSELKEKISKVVEKACLCVGLGNAVMDYHKLELPKGNHGVVVCPGPNLAYFNKISSLKEMIDHIYGKSNKLFNANRPNVFIKEIKIYMDYLKSKIDECKDEFTPPQIKYFNTFKSNMQDGVTYYKEMFSKSDELLENMRDKVLEDLSFYKKELAVMYVPQPVK